MHIDTFYRHFEELQGIVNDTLELIDKIEDGQIEIDYADLKERLEKATENAIFEAQSAKEELK